MNLIIDEHCFACGTKNQHGLHLPISLNEGEQSAHTTTVIDQKFCGWQNMIHGGIISTILDEVMVYATIASGTQCVTAELNIRFKSPLTAGTKITASGTVTEIKKRIYKTHGVIVAEDGTTIAEAKGTMIAKKAL